MPKPTVQQIVLPVKDQQVQRLIEQTLLNGSKAGRRNYTIWRVGVKTMLRVSDVLNLRKADVFNPDGTVVSELRTTDIKTGKVNRPFIAKAALELERYHDWLDEQGIVSEWLFPSLEDHNKAISTKMFYKVMRQTGDLLNVPYLGTHSMRKTGAYQAYEQSGHDIAFVMMLLNHSSQAMTLKYLGLDRETLNEKMAGLDFGSVL